MNTTTANLPAAENFRWTTEGYKEIQPPASNKPICASYVRCEESMYTFCHGRAPRGSGNWAFIVEGNGDELFTIFARRTMSYSEAKSLARKAAAECGFYAIKPAT